MGISAILPALRKERISHEHFFGGSHPGFIFRPVIGRLQTKNRRIFAVSVIVISLLLYIGGLFGSLSIGFYAVVALAVLSVPALALLLVKRRQSWKLLATPGLLAFLLLLFIVWNGHRGRLFSRWDEFFPLGAGD